MTREIKDKINELKMTAEMARHTAQAKHEPDNAFKEQGKIDICDELLEIIENGATEIANDDDFFERLGNGR